MHAQTRLCIHVDIQLFPTCSHHFSHITTCKYLTYAIRYWLTLCIACKLAIFDPPTETYAITGEVEIKVSFRFLDDSAHFFYIYVLQMKYIIPAPHAALFKTKLLSDFFNNSDGTAYSDLTVYNDPQSVQRGFQTGIYAGT